ncbi:hypothetical protein LR48_Vigan07g132700 [Vigna angularis]|uniref:Uncharacterized protein n=1 Tax=Phaseolus angularis TaxID=3914 RepID=A0A0L9UXX4_PHAAN|nr:hypothetical protein LR48_Vigan07g132700 [Vigna angularis]
MKLMKEVKRDRDGIRKGHKKCKRRETTSTAQRKLPLSDTLKDPLAPLRGEMPLRGRIGHTLLPLSGRSRVRIFGWDEAKTHSFTPWRRILDAKAPFSTF